MRCKIFIIFSLCIICVVLNFTNAQSCVGLKADAGPDLFTCDPTMPVQLMGNFNGTPTKYYWTPTTYLSDPNALDPIVNAPVGKYKYTFNVEAVSTTNLIVNGTFESGNTGFTHDYIYGNPGGPFGPGNLGVGNNPPAYNGGFSPCGDHTTGTGNMLVVDASLTPNSHIWCQTVAVGAGKSYLFRFYVQSLYPVAPAQLIAQANGVTFGSVSAGAVCDWQMFEACFMATTASAQMCITETTNIGFGDDFAVDDIEMYEKCMDKDDVEIEVVDLKAKIQVPTLPKCASDIFDLNAIGSSVGPNVMYVWRSEGGQIVSQNGLSAKGKGSGKYFVKVLYKNGNVDCEKEVEIDILASDDLEGTLEVEGIANCKLDTILLKAKTNNGSGNFSYQWIPNNKILRGQNDTVAYVTDAGIYKVVIRDLDSGCETEIQEVVVSDTSKPNLKISGDTLINCLKNQVSLFGNPFDTTKYSYEWLLPDSSKIKNKDSIFSKTAGVFSLKIIDKVNKCYTDKNWNVTIDTLKPNIDLGPDQKIDCINTTVNILPIGNNSNATINYFWTLPSGNLPLETSLKTKNENKGGQVLLRLVNTKNGCEESDTLLIDDLRKIPNVDAGIGATLNCKIIDFTLDGSKTKTDSANYFWSTQNGNIISGSNSLTPKINAPGWYYLNLEDSTNHCKNIDSVLINQNIITPSAILGPDKIFTCADSILTIDGSNSTQSGQLKFNWNSTNGIIDSGQGTLIIKIKSPGDYYLVVLDTINFCSDTASLSVKPDLNAPIASISVNDTLTCTQSSVTLFGTASSPSGDSVKYSWSSSAGQAIQNGNSLNPIVTQPGEYILKVIDQVNGCSIIVKDTVSIDTIKPIADSGPGNIWNCKTTQLILDGSNSLGNHGLLYQWSTADGSIIGTSQQKKIDVGSPGTYILKVIDLINGCESTDQTIIQKDLTIPNAIVQTPDTLTCINATVTISGQGSSSGNRFIYNWITTNGQISGAKDQINIVADKPGDYKLIVTDTINGCTQQQSVLIIEDNIQPIIDAGVSNALSCQTLDLLLTGNITGNTSNMIKWTTNLGSILSSSDSIQIKINKPGIYYFEVTNTANGCTSLDSVSVTKNNNLIVDAGASTELSCQILNATLTGNLQNNAGNEQIIWKTNQGKIISKPDSLQIKINKPGIYYFEVSNALTGCSGLDSVIVTKINNLIVDAGGSTELTCRIKDETLSGSLQNNAGNELVNWTTNQGHFIGNTNTAQVKVDRAGWYYFVVTNNNSGCNGIDSVLITENTNIPASLNLDIQQPKCPGDSWQTEITNIIGGEKPIQVFLENQLINGLMMQGNSPGNYNIKVVDKNGCELTTSFNIITPQGVSVQLVPLVKLSAGVEYDIIPMYSIPDDSIASVLWSPSIYLSCTDCLYPVVKGIDRDTEYTVTYTNHNGCSATARIRIELVKRNIWVPNAFSANGDNINDSFYPVVSEDSYNEIRSMLIYDRWGNLLFSREHFPPNDPHYGWNGDSNNERVNPGVYIYIIEVEWRNGTAQLLHGDITLIR